MAIVQTDRVSYKTRLVRMSTVYSLNCCIVCKRHQYLPVACFFSFLFAFHRIFLIALRAAQHSVVVCVCVLAHAFHCYAIVHILVCMLKCMYACMKSVLFSFSSINNAMWCCAVTQCESILEFAIARFLPLMFSVAQTCIITRKKKKKDTRRRNNDEQRQPAAAPTSSS